MSVLVRRNQRTATRHSLRVPCQVVREDDFQLLGEATMDLSIDGMLVRSDADAAPGDHVVITFQATPLGLWFDAEGTVTRIVKGRRPGDNGRALGVKFHNMSYLSRLLLRGHLRRQPPPLPKRTVRVDWAESVRQIAAS
jgi:hypothetical protein